MLDIDSRSGFHLSKNKSKHNHPRVNNDIGRLIK